jgi:hypothetical protein
MYVVEVWDRKLDDGSAERRIGRSAVVMVNRAAEISISSNCSTFNAKRRGKESELYP